MKTKLPKLGTIWPVGAKIQFIDETTWKWATVATCMDTPNAISMALQEQYAKNPGKTLWVNSTTKGRYIP